MVLETPPAAVEVMQAVEVSNALLNSCLPASDRLKEMIRMEFSFSDLGWAAWATCSLILNA